MISMAVLLLAPYSSGLLLCDQSEPFHLLRQSVYDLTHIRCVLLRGKVSLLLSWSSCVLVGGVAVCGAARLVISRGTSSDWRSPLRFLLFGGCVWIRRALAEGVIHGELGHGGGGAGGRGRGSGRAQATDVAVARDYVRIANYFWRRSYQANPPAEALRSAKRSSLFWVIWHYFLIVDFPYRARARASIVGGTPHLPIQTGP